MKLDAIDRAILSELQHNARVKNSILAARVGLSPPACLQRVRRLEKRGVIAGYRAILNWSGERAQFDAWAELALRNADANSVSDFAEFLRRASIVFSAHQLGRTEDFLVHVIAPSMTVWQELLAELPARGFEAEVKRIMLVLDCVKPPIARVSGDTRLVA